MSKTSLIALAERQPTRDWVTPEELIAPDNLPTPFPIEALGSMARAAKDIQAHVKCPAALAAASVLSAASLAVQGSFDVAFRGKDTRPVSLFILTIGRSGERKSTADQYAMIGVHRHIKGLRAQARHQRQVNESCDGEPFLVLSPEILASNGTVEGLQQGFLEGHPSQALMSDEAGQFLGGHSLKAENRLHGLATLSKFWDAGVVTKKIRGTGNSSDTRTMIDCRLSVHMLGQRVAINPFLKDPTARGQGSLARFLVHEPLSTMGSRNMTVAEWNENAATTAIMAFAEKIENLLKYAAVRNSEGEVQRETLQMNEGAVRALVDFYNKIESKLAPTGDLSGYADLANKIHENAARIAGILAVMDDEPVITIEIMQRGIQLASYFLNEIVRLSDLLPASSEVEKAKLIANWLRKRGGAVEVRHFSQTGPKSCRTIQNREEAIALLKEKGWLQEFDRTFVLNPKLSDGGYRGYMGDRQCKQANAQPKPVALSEAT